MQGEDDSDSRNKEIIALGVEAQSFIDSKVFDFICNAAEVKVMQARDALATVNPNNTQEIIRLQTEIARFNHFNECLREMTMAGDQAYQIFIQDLESNNIEQ